MTRLFLLATLLVALAPVAQADHLWINEFHYDNPGGDVNEFVEVAVRSGPAFSAADYSVFLYNGSNGTVYSTTALTDFTVSAAAPIAGSSETVRFFTFVYPTNGLQNGAPDGLALVNTATNTVVEFLSYEGTMDATDGPAAGTTSVDVGVAEPGVDNNSSIGYTGTGDRATAFTFALATAQTPGAVNQGQTLSGAAAAESASVTFNPTSATTAETTAYTSGTIVYTLANTDGNAANNPAASGTITITSGNAGQIQSFTTTYSFPVGTATGATRPFNATPVNDNVFTGNRDVVFGFGTPTASTASGTFTLTITDDETPPPVTSTFLINEIDVDQTGIDTAEFVEILGPPNTSLTGLTLVALNGSNNEVYGTYDLNGFTTNAAGLYVVSIPSNGLQNGPDGVALYTGVAPATATTTNLVDAIVYGVNDSPATALLAALGLPETYQFEENYEGMKDTQSLARLNVTTPGGAGVSALFYVQTPSPGLPNAGTVTVNETSGVDDVAGYRLLGFPVVRPATAQPFQVADLAPINLIQGIPAGTVNPAQYPQAPQNANGTRANVFPTYQAGAGPSPYLAPSSTDVGLPPAAGFIWYFYDQDIPRANIPATFGPGTSQSFELTNAAFQLSATGIALDDRLNGTATPGPFSATTPTSPDGQYMGANPFAYPVLLSGIQTSSGTIGTVFQTYNPSNGSFVILMPSDVVSPWQGVFLNISGATGATVQIQTSSTNVVPTSNVALVGRTAEARIAFGLTGTLASGASVEDRAAIVRFLEDATMEWDRHDAKKLTPPQETFALLAPVGTENGASVRQAVRSLALDAETTMPFAFRATEAGSFSLTWDAATLPAGLQASLRDMTTGTVLDLRAATSYSFTADATDWSNRFELVIGRGSVAGEASPTALALSAPAPNPASQRSAMTLRVDAAQHVTATVIDALGRTVATVFDADMVAGAETQIVVETGRLAPGIYVVRVAGETFAEARRITVAR